MRRLLGTLVFAAGATACIGVLGLEKLSVKASDSDGGEDDGAADGAPDGGPGVCPVDTIDAQSRPGPQSAGENPRFFAFNRLEVGAAADVGFDLDHTTTTTDALTSSCTFTSGADPIEDAVNGIDNVSAELLSTVAVLAPALSTKGIDDRLRAGYFGMLVGLGGWNGTPNDDSVTVLLFPALGLWGPSMEPGGPRNPNRRTIVDGGDPTDVWMRDGRFPANGNASTSVEAWVKDGKLVARYDTLLLPIRSDFDLKLIDLPLRDGWLTADLSPGSGDARSTALHNGVLGGRVTLMDFLVQLALLYTGTEYVCHRPGALDLAPATLCKYRDIRSSHCDDHRSLPCDALSVGVRFDTYPIDKLGQVYVESPAVYADAGLLVAEARCTDVDLDGGLRCPP